MLNGTNKIEKQIGLKQGKDKFGCKQTEQRAKQNLAKLKMANEVLAFLETKLGDKAAGAMDNFLIQYSIENLHKTLIK
jgi:hypothetical protein